MSANAAIFCYVLSTVRLRFIFSLPPLIKLIIITLVAIAGGFAGGYFLFRLRFKKELGRFEARETAFKYREAEFERVRPSLPEHDTENVRLRATVDLLREELEQKEMEMGITQEEHQLELHLLQKEIETARNGDRGPSRLEIEIEDAAYESTENLDPLERPSQTEATSSETDPSPVTEAAERTSHVDQPEPTANESEEVDHVPEQSRKESHQGKPASLQPENQADGGSSSSDPAEWATSLVQDWISSLVSSLSPQRPEDSSEEPTSDEEPVVKEAENTEPKETAEPVTSISSEADEELPEKASAAEREGTLPESRDPRRLSYPSYRSIIEYMVAPERGPVSGRIDYFESGSTVEKAGLQLLLGLPDEEFKRLAEMGYSTYEDIAQLTSPQIHELSDRFDIPESRIVNVWISGAHLRLYEES